MKTGKFILIRGLILVFVMALAGHETAAGSPVTAGISPQSVAGDPTGKYVYVANAGSNNVSMYRIGANGVLADVNVQAVSEEARRRMGRGEAAVEMAKSPEDYEQAIMEFQEAGRLEPTWAAPYYNLGLVQEKIGKFREAVASLSRYLQLAPNAPDAAKVKELIYKLEYKAERENILTIADIVDILASIGNKEVWEIMKRGCYDRYNNFSTCNECGFFDAYAFVTRAGSDRIKVPKMIFYDSGVARVAEAESYNIIKIAGPVVKFAIAWSFCGYPPRIPGWNRSDNSIEYEIEVASKTHVKVRQKGFDVHAPCRMFAGEYRKR